MLQMEAWGRILTEDKNAIVGFISKNDNMINPLNAEIIVFKPWRPKGFSIWNHHKYLSKLFLNHFNTYVIYFFQCGDRLYTSESDVYRRQILANKDVPLAERVYIVHFVQKHDNS